METPSEIMQNNQYSLSIRLNSDGFSLFVYDPSNHLLSTKSVSALLYSLSEEEIIRLFKNETECGLNYNLVRIICELNAYCIAPIPLFKHHEASNLLHFQHKEDKKEQVKYNVLKRWDIVNIFAIPRALTGALTDLFPDVSVEHHLSWFMADKVQLHTETVLYVYVRATMMDVVLLENGSIKLVNSFAYQTTEDIAYFTLRFYDQLGLDSEHCSVRLYNAENKTELKKIIRKYVKHCEAISD